MQDFRNLRVWKDAHELAVAVYPVAKGLPVCEKYGLTSQIKRAATSIPINLAEGCGRGSDADFCRFVQIAFGSSRELEYLLLLCQELTLIKASDCNKLAQKLLIVQRGLLALRNRLIQVPIQVSQS